MTRKISENDMEVIEINGVKGVKRGNVISAVIATDKLVPVAWNANAMSDAEYIRLKKTIVEDGFLDPLTVIPAQNGYFTINGGEHRYRACKELGIASIPCEIMYEDKWLDEDLQKLQSVRSNVIHGRLNPNKLLELYNAVADKHGKEAIAGLMGFTSQDGLNQIIKKVSKELKDTLPQELSEKFDKEAKDVKTVHDLEKIISHIFQEHGDTLNYNFIVFSYGGKDHCYVSLNKDGHRDLNKMLELAKRKRVDVGSLFTTIFTNMINQLDEEEID